MKKLELDLGAFSVSLDHQAISLEILYKGVPLQIICFGTSSPNTKAFATIDAQKDRLLDAHKVGQLIQTYFSRMKILPRKYLLRALPDWLLDRAKVIDFDGEELPREFWESNIVPFEKGRAIKRNSVRRALRNAERNYNWYKYQTEIGCR